MAIPNIRGINTAATLWCAAAIGVLTGSGYLFQAFIGTIVVLLANIVIRSFQHKIDQGQPKQLEMLCCLEMVCDSGKDAQIRLFLTKNLSERNYPLVSLSGKSLEDQKEQLHAEFVVPGESQAELEKVINEFRDNKSISFFSWKLIPGSHQFDEVKSLEGKF